MKRLFIMPVLVFLCVLNIQCSKDEKNKAPIAVNLIYPTQNLLCTDNTINFNWSKATDPENDALEYNLIIATDRSMTNVINNKQGTSSEIFAFFTKGEGVLNYAPFSAELVSPENNSNQSASTSISLVWDAADINTTDILTYELYFGENSTLTLIDDSLSDKSRIVSVESGKSYSWKVNVKDQNGAKSIGQIWSFTVN
jgi:hypothetical protein